MTPDQGTSTTQVIAHMGLRANRVVLLVPGEGDWRLKARQGINTVTSFWGGAGFVVVPVTSTELHPALLAAVRAYDPDIVAVPHEDSSILVKDRDTLHRAQETVSAACSNYRSLNAKGPSVASPTRGMLAEAYLVERGLIPTTPLHLLVDLSIGSTIGANPALGGSLGLSAAARWGLSDWPTGDDTPIDQIDQRLLKRAIWRLVSYSTESDGLANVTTRNEHEGDFATDFARTLYGLTPVYESEPDRPPVVVVWGDEPADFALAMTWDRTYGYGIWLPNEWWRDPDLHSQIISGIGILASNARAQYRPIVFTSTSISRADLESRLEDCRQDAFGFISDALDLAEERTAVPAGELDFPRFNKSHYAIRRRFSDEWSTIVHDDEGTIDFAMLPPVPAIGVPELDIIESRAHWQVDLVVRKHNIPVSTAIPEQELLAAGQSTFPTRIRAARSCISFASHRTDWVPGEATVEQKLTRPLIRYPSLLKWADVRARLHSMSVRISAAGAQSRLLATMVGGRSKLAELVSGPLLPALQAFNRTGASRDAFPDREGCVVNREGFLTFKRICGEADMQADTDARDTIDELLRWGILHRGLLLRCAVCAYYAFIPLEAVGPSNRCQRCLGDTALSRESWRLPIEEPAWFYDLHRTARLLLNAKGHVPLQLANYLERDSDLGFADAPEFELVSSEGDSAVETDLLALVDRQLIVAEAKTTSTFGAGKGLKAAVRKRVLAAS